VIDTLYVAMFIYKNLYLTAALYAFFVFLALLGLRAWQKTFDTQLLSETPAHLAEQKSDLT
jgi:nicotinamide mononucleotide transporter